MHDRVDTSLSRDPRKTWNALIEEYATLKRVSATASLPMTTYLRAAMGERAIEMRKIIVTILCPV